MSEWIEFSNRLLKISDIDFFELASENIIQCHFHQGLSYAILEESHGANFTLERFNNLKDILKIKPAF